MSLSCKICRKEKEFLIFLSFMFLARRSGFKFIVYVNYCHNISHNIFLVIEINLTHKLCLYKSEDIKVD